MLNINTNRNSTYNNDQIVPDNCSVETRKYLRIVNDDRFVPTVATSSVNIDDNRTVDLSPFSSSSISRLNSNPVSLMQITSQQQQQPQQRSTSTTIRKNSSINSTDSSTKK
ncbi:uncharacterized protein LOC142597480 [Dermatophagoides farinae]|uniref:uncharacterized protein LOC142597480 n=1 Tax=Dermatophagoides farinae TaxID=6954 RepID=UPI003F60DDBC